MNNRRQCRYDRGRFAADAKWVILCAAGRPKDRPLQNHAEKLRRYGEENGSAELTTPKMRCTEEDCWRYTALACLLGEAQGGYRGPTGGPLVFMTYGTVMLSKTHAASAT